MHKLTRAEILELPVNDSALYHIRLERLREPAPVVEYEGPSLLHIQRGAAKGKASGRLACVTPLAYPWAEGCDQDVEGDGTVVVEDFAMEVFRLPQEG